MIRSIGIQRVIILGSFAGLFCILFLLNTFYFAPSAMESEQQLNGVTAEMATFQAEIDKMKSDEVFFETQKDVFAKIKRLGFFDGQDRVKARERFDTIQKLSKIISAKYEIKAASIMPDESPTPSPYEVTESPVSVTLSALDDLDVYRFIYYLNYGFPGQVSINSLNIERKRPVTIDVVKQIGSGKPPELISATMNVTWRTMAPKKDVVLNESGEAVSPPDPATVTP